MSLKKSKVTEGVFYIKAIAFIAILFVSINIYSQNNNSETTFKANNEELVEVLRRLADEKKIEISFVTTIIPKPHKVTCSFTNENITEILNQLLKNTNITFNELNSTIILYKRPTLPKEEFASKPKKSAGSKIKTVYRYVYDTVRSTVIDTIVTYKYDTLLVHDTITHQDTIKLSLYEKDYSSSHTIEFKYKSKLHEFESNRLLINNSTKSSEIVSISNYHSFLVQENVYRKSFFLSIGAGMATWKENILYKKEGLYSTHTETVVVREEKLGTYYEKNSYLYFNRITSDGTNYTDSLLLEEPIERYGYYYVYSDSSFNVADTLIHEITIDKESSILVASVPISFGIQKTIRTKFMLEAATGMEYYLLLNRQYLVDSYKNETPYIYSHRLCFTGSFLALYKVEKRIGLFLGAEAKYSPKTAFIEYDKLNRNYTHIGFQTGVRLFL